MDLSYQLEEDELDNVEETNHNLGRGAYGEVNVVKYRGKEYAGKYFYQKLMTSDDIYHKCLKECRRAFKIKHPNIVETIGTFRNGKKHSLILVMEKLPYCLYEFVYKQERELPEYIKLRILHDVSKGLSHLHIQGIMHRDLTASNVLLTNTLTAKISDFGQSKFISFAPKGGADQTPVPGNLIYMPPEAIGTVHDAKHVDLVEYNFSIDVYSFGVLMIHVYLHEIPQPEAQFEAVRELFRLRTPLECFRKDIQRSIPDTHPLNPLLCQCLNKSPGNRPSAESLVTEIGTLLDENKSIFKNLMQSVVRCQELETVKTDLEGELEKRKDNLEMKNRELELQGEDYIKLRDQWKNLKGMVNTYKKRSVSLPKDSSHSNEHAVTNRNGNHGDTGKSAATPVNTQDVLTTLSNTVLQESLTKSMMKGREERNLLWEENQQLREEIKRLQREVERLTEPNPTRDRSLTASSNSALLESMRDIPIPDNLPATVVCKDEDVRDFIDNRKKFSMKGAQKTLLSFSHVEGAKAVLLQGTVYMGRATETILSYNRVDGKWNSLPPAPVRNYAIVNYEGRLTLVGGSCDHVLSKNVYCYDEVARSWSKNDIPPIKTPRENAIAVSHMKHLIVMGGVTSKAIFFADILKSIEVYCDKFGTKQWINGPDMPRPGFVLQYASAQDHLYLLHPDGWTIRYCSLDHLVRATLNQTKDRGLWKSITRSIPFTRCSLTVYDNTLLTVAGAGSDGHIYAYYPKNEKWERISCLGSLPAIKNGSCLQVGQFELFLCGGDIDMMNQTSQAGYLLAVEEPTSTDGDDSDGRLSDSRRSSHADSSREHVSSGDLRN